MRAPGHRPAAASRQLDILLREDPSLEERFARVRGEASRGQSPDGPVNPGVTAAADSPAGSPAGQSPDGPVQAEASAGQPPDGPVDAAVTGAGESLAGFESVLSSVAAAVTLVTIADGRDDVGVTVSAFCPVSIEPPLILISLLEDSYPAELLGRLDRFAVTALASGQRALAGRVALAGRPGASLLLEDVPHHRGALSGALIPDEGLLAMECEAVSRIQAGDHLLVIGLAQSVIHGKESDAPLIRFRGRYPVLS